MFLFKREKNALFAHQKEGEVFSYHMKLYDDDYILNFKKSTNKKEMFEELVRKRVIEAKMSFFNDLSDSRAIVDFSFKNKVSGFGYCLENSLKEPQTIMNGTIDKEKKDFSIDLDFDVPILNNFLVRHYTIDNWTRNEKRLEIGFFLKKIISSFIDKKESGDLRKTIKMLDYKKQLFI